MDSAYKSLSILFIILVFTFSQIDFKMCLSQFLFSFKCQYVMSLTAADTLEPEAPINFTVNITYTWIIYLRKSQIIWKKKHLKCLKLIRLKFVLMEISLILWEKGAYKEGTSEDFVEALDRASNMELK